jgi:predicted nucleic acid-binding protein
VKTVFADSFYFFALLNVHDPAHAKAIAYTRPLTGRLMTTGWILTEVADGLAKPSHRRAVFMQLHKDLKATSNMIVTPCDETLLEEAISLYGQRLDKEWSLTDCTSFVVMQRDNLREALTGDRHFEQAGFIALLK